MIAFTSDIDWAPEEVISETLRIFEFYNTKCTLFATHDSEVVKTCNRNLFEIAIHPNFNKRISGIDDRQCEEIISELLTTYPEAIGIRSHSLMQSSPLLNTFLELGLKYDSNQFFPYEFNLKPYESWNGLWRIPYNWEDDIHFNYKKDFDALDVLGYNAAKFMVFNFHPIHIFINTDTEAHYLDAKSSYHDTEGLKKSINITTKGAKDYLIATLEYVRSNNIKTYNLKEVYQHFSNYSLQKV